MPITTPKVPDGLPELMRGLAKSVIKENPENIYVHAAEYFENLIRDRDGELDREYKHFSAYKVYSDYKDKCRGRGGAHDGGSLSAGSVGDIPSSAGGMALRSGTASAGDGDDDSGGSALATRGRRKKRIRKQGSKDSIKSVEKQESAEVLKVEDDNKSSVNGQDSRHNIMDAIKEDSPELIEETMVKVQAHQEYQKPKESKAINKTVSVDSMTAANAVSSVLQDAVIESDEADRETGEAIETQVEADLAVELQQPTNCEDLDSYPPDEDGEEIKHGDCEDYGSTPSTAEVIGEVVGEPEALDEDIPPANGTIQSEDDVDAPLEQKKTPDELDLPVNDSFEKKVESVVNGSIEVKSESPKKSSDDINHDSSEAQAEGVDTVDANNSTLEVEETVQELPNVPIEEPGSEGEKSVASEVEPIVEEPTEEESNPDETKEEIIEDANVIDSPKESSVDELPGVDEKSTEEPTEEKSSGVVQVQHTDSVGEVVVQENPSKIMEESESKDESVEADTNGPSNSEDIESKEVSKEKSPGDNIENDAISPLEVESNPKSTEEQAADKITLDNENHQNTENISLDKNQSEEKSEINEDQVSGEAEEKTEHMSVKSESMEVPSSSPQEDANAESIQESTKSAAPPVKSSSVEDQDVVEENPSELPETVGTSEKPTSEGSVPKESVNSIDRPADVPESNGPAKASKEPSLNKTESEVNVESSAVENNLDNSPEKQGSAEEPPSEQSAPKGSVDDVEKPTDESTSNKPSLDKTNSVEISAAEETPPVFPEKVELTEEPLSEGNVPKESVGSIDEPADEPQSSGSAKISKEPSLEKTESDLNASVDQSNPASKESSAKESEGDTSAEAVSDQGQDGSVDAGEISLSSRMGNDEEDAEPEHPVSTEKDDEAVEEPQNNPEDLVDDVIVEPSAPPSEDATENEAEAKPSSDEKDSPKQGESIEENTEKSEISESKEEVVEEPCIQKQVSPSTSMIPIKQPSVELEDIKKVDLASFNKDSAEALFYSLKKTELENQENTSEHKTQDDDDDDADVVVKDEPPPSVSRQPAKRGFTDDFLENSPITEEANEQAEGGGVSNEDNGKDNGSEVFNPMMAARARNSQLLHQLHSRDDINTLETSPRKKPIRRCMTERVDLARQETSYVDLRKYDPDYVEEEDQFDGYYIGSIKHKILASSVSVADSDYYDPEQAETIIDDNNVHTALETIASTDTESTLPSQTTIQANKGFLKRSSQNTSSNIPYASFGNNAINQSLDDFIEREEQLKEAEAQAASTIQRSYRRFQTNKRKLLRDYQSTMQTCTEDQSTESLEDYPNSVIQIKLDQKRPEGNDNSFEDSRIESSRRPMYSLNIDEYDTVTRRMTLTRGVAMQRNSTPEEDSGKSDNTSSEKKSSASEPATNVALADESPISSSDLSEDKKSSTSGDEKENKDNSSSKSSAAVKEPSEGMRAVSAALSNSGRQFASLDVQRLFIARQRTMPVQIETSVIRAQPKHTRKRIKSAGMIRK